MSIMTTDADPDRTTDPATLDVPPTDAGEFDGEAARSAEATPPQQTITLTPLQVQNDPLLGATDGVFRDLADKLRLAVVCYGALGVVAAWLIAIMLAIGGDNPSAYAWAGGATLAIAAAAYWLLTGYSARFTGQSAYRSALGPAALARLDRPAVVGLLPLLGTALALVLVGTAAACLAIALFFSAASPWLWLVAAIALALLYGFGFLLLALRLIERVRDAVATV